MNEKYSCVVDANGYYKTLVLEVLRKKIDGTEAWEVQHYELQDGESLVPRTDDCRQPTERPHVGAVGFVRPKWNADTSTWVEGAMAQEIAAWELEHPAPDPMPPSLEERNRADIDFLAIMQGVQL